MSDSSRFSENEKLRGRFWAATIIGLIGIILRYTEIILISWWLVFIPFLVLFLFIFLEVFKLYRILIRDMNSRDPKLDMTKYGIKAVENSKDLSTTGFWLYLCKVIKDIRKKRITRL